MSKPEVTFDKEAGMRVPVKVWNGGRDPETGKSIVHFDDNTYGQINDVAKMPFIHHHVAVMPDAHLGIGATVGSVIPTKGAIIPAAVGVDIGCGMVAVRTSLMAEDMPDNLAALRSDIERVVPVGNAINQELDDLAKAEWANLAEQYEDLLKKHPDISPKNRHPSLQLGSLGGGNHFEEICIDEEGRVWVMLHSGSRGIGNIIGRKFIGLATDEAKKYFIPLPNKDLAYFAEGTIHFIDYVEAVAWAQAFAAASRRVMLKRVLRMLAKHVGAFTRDDYAINCHHNYVSLENHYGANVWVTRKGAVRARKGDLGIIPGSMGDRSFIVEGLGNPDSFDSCSHGAGRVMSREEAKRTFTVEDHKKATAGIECRKDIGVIDETPRAYKNIDAVMAAQSDLVKPIHTLRQILCVKG